MIKNTIIINTSVIQLGFEICRLVEPVNGFSFKINNNVLDIVAYILEHHE